MIKIECRTLFDITATGVVGHFKNAQPPYTKIESWTRARNQQRNWETLSQLINLRTQIMSITDPVVENSEWTFTFESESNVWDNGTDPLGTLKADGEGVPMLLDLDNRSDIESSLVTTGPRQNIWFTIIPINTILEN